MNVHRLAKYFPILEGEEFDLLVEDIRKNGQREPIITKDGEILDGVNRYRACEVLGMPPRTEEYEGDDPLAYVVSLNVRRRHLTESQRAMLATEMLPEFEKIARQHMSMGGKGASVETPIRKSTAQAAKQFGVSRPSVERAKRIKVQAPEKVEEIIRGQTTVRAVDSELRQVQAEKRAAESAVKAADKSVKEHPKVVAEYLESTKQFKRMLGLAIEAKRRGLFSLEAIQFVINRHCELREMMDELEED